MDRDSNTAGPLSTGGRPQDEHASAPSSPDPATIPAGFDKNRRARAVPLHEWVQIVRRARLDALIGGSGKVGKDGKPTRGGVSGLTVTAIALTFASYADGDGSSVRPGDATVAVDLETTIAQVRTVRQKLVALGLLTAVGRPDGAGRRQYQLTIPDDLLEQLVVLTPAQHKLVARGLRDKARGKRSGSSDGAPQSTVEGGPAEPPGAASHRPAGGPAEHPDGGGVNPVGWSGGPAEIGVGYSGGPPWGTPADPRTYQDHPPTTTIHPGEDLRTAVPGPRAIRAVEDPISSVVDNAPPPAAAGPDRCEHGLAPGHRSDGRPACPICRVLEDQAAGRSRPATRDATVIPFPTHARTA